MICVIDTSNIFFITYSMFIKTLKKNNGPDYEVQEEDLGLFWHMFIRYAMPYLTTFENTIWAFEGHNSTAYRKQIYPLYKENRKDRKDDPDYRFIGPLLNDIEKYLSLFHCKTMRVDNCEGDDVIYAVSKYYSEKGEEVQIVSGDEDLTQIALFYDTVSVFNPIKNRKAVPNPNIIQKKAIVGDMSDNIKGVPRIGEKIFEKMLEDQVLWNKKMTPENIEIYETVLKIVDLRKYPKEYQDNVVAELESKDWNSFDKNGVELFFMEHGLKKCQEEWSSQCGQIEMMLNGNDMVAAEDEIAQILAGDF